MRRLPANLECFVVRGGEILQDLFDGHQLLLVCLELNGHKKIRTEGGWNQRLWELTEIELQQPTDVVHPVLVAASTARFKWGGGKGVCLCLCLCLSVCLCLCV